MSEREPLSIEQVRHVAALAQLTLGPDEAEVVRDDLNAILKHIERLAEVDVSGIEPMTTPHEHCSRLHEDTPESPLCIDTVLKMAPQTEDEWISVPRILGDQDA